MPMNDINVNRHKKEIVIYIRQYEREIKQLSEGISHLTCRKDVFVADLFKGGNNKRDIVYLITFSHALLVKWFIERVPYFGD